MYRNPPPHGGPPPYHQPPPGAYPPQGYRQQYDQPYEPRFGPPPYEQAPYAHPPMERPPYDHRAQYGRRPPYEQAAPYEQPYPPAPYPPQGPPQYFDPYGQDPYARPPKRYRGEPMSGPPMSGPPMSGPPMSGPYPPSGEYQGPPPPNSRPPRQWPEYPPPPQGYDQPPDYPPYQGYPQPQGPPPQGPPPQGPPPQGYPPRQDPRREYPPHPPHPGYPPEYQEPYPYTDPYQQPPRAYPPPHGNRLPSEGRYRDDKLPRSIQWKRSEQPPEKLQAALQSQQKSQASPSLASVHAAHGLPAPPASASQRTITSSSLLKPHPTSAAEWRAPRPTSFAAESRTVYGQGERGAANEDGESEAGEESGEHGDERFYLDFDWDMPGRMPDVVPNPELQLGIIIWRPAVAVENALPATVAEAEAQLKKPPPRKRGKQEESLSKYATDENLHELSVRQTDEWSKVKDDPVYFEFPVKDKIVPLEEVKINRQRPDRVSDLDLEMTDMEEGEVKQESRNDEDWNVMDSLEQALSPSSEYSTGNKPSPRARASAMSPRMATVFHGPATSGRLPTPPLPTPYPSSHGPTPPFQTTAGSKYESPPVSVSSAHRRLLKPKAYGRNLSQDDHLVASGLTGSPQAGYESSGPAPVPLSDSRSPDLHTRLGGAHVANGSAVMRHTPPARHRSGSSSPPDPWSADGQGAHRHSPTGSARSGQTLAGSDFHPEESNGTDHMNGLDGKEIIPGSLLRSESTMSRKRAYEERENSEERGDNEIVRQVDDVTPRIKRRQPRVAEAYSRRW